MTKITHNGISAASSAKFDLFSEISEKVQAGEQLHLVLQNSPFSYSRICG